MSDRLSVGTRETRCGSQPSPSRAGRGGRSAVAPPLSPSTLKQPQQATEQEAPLPRAPPSSVAAALPRRQSGKQLPGHPAGGPHSQEASAHAQEGGEPGRG